MGEVGACGAGEKVTRQEVVTGMEKANGNRPASYQLTKRKFEKLLP